MGVMDPRLSVVSIIVPVLNESAGIAATLSALAPLRAQGHEVIVVDGSGKALISSAPVRFYVHRATRH